MGCDFAWKFNFGQKISFLCSVLTLEAAFSPKRQQIPALHRRKWYSWCRVSFWNVRAVSKMPESARRSCLVCDGSTYAAIWEWSCEVLVTRCTWRPRVFLSPTGVSAAKCHVLQLLQHRQQVNTSERSDLVLQGCYKPDKFVSRSSTYIFNTTCRLSPPHFRFPSIFPPEVTTYSLSIMCATCERPSHPRQFDRTHNIWWTVQIMHSCSFILSQFLS